MNLIAAYTHFTWARTLKRLQTWALCGAVALAGLLGAGQAWAGDPFVDNGDGTVTDTSTGLMWDQCADGLSGNGSCATGALVPYTWANALGLAATRSWSNYKGYSDWRLPSVVELKTLVKAGSFSPSIDTAAFPNTSMSYFWSASSAPVPSDAWFVGFVNGAADASDKANAVYVRLVRSGQYFGSFGLFPVGVSGITASAATLTATSATGATGHWLVVPRNATPPTWAQIIAGTSYPTVTVAAHGSGAMTANTPATLPLAGLAAGTSYDLYMVARESTYQTTSNISGPVPFSTLAIATSSIVIDPVNAQIVYSGTDGAGVYKSTNAGVAWTAANSTLGSTQRVKALLIKPGTSGTTGANATLFAATYGSGVFKSTDSAATWSACNSVSLGNLNVLSLGMNASASTLYAGTEGGVFVSSDDCANWTAMNTGMP